MGPFDGSSSGSVHKIDVTVSGRSSFRTIAGAVAATLVFFAVVVTPGSGRLWSALHGTLPSWKVAKQCRRKYSDGRSGRCRMIGTRVGSLHCMT